MRIVSLSRLIKYSLPKQGGLGWIFFILILTSCGSRDGYFKLEGHFLKMNQGEFYLYSPDGIITGIDTLKLNGGRFSHEIPCATSGLLMLVFPNFSEQPIFAEEGQSVSLDGDASHLKELKVKGTKANELMTKFRMQISKISPLEEQKHAASFIKENPASPVSIYLLRRYFILTDKPDFKQADELLTLIKSKQKSSTALTRIETDLAKSKATAKDQKVPQFSGFDINGRPVTNANLGGSLSVIYTWASWSYESLEQQRQLRRIARQHGSALNLIGISADASKQECIRAMKRDSVPTPVVCDGQMFESPLMTQLGFTQVPDNIIVSKEGRILEHGLNVNQLKDRLEKLLK
ncbi:MAG: AhpC/TSA family protein [Prevotella sp.]|nr:AhpC/TSA family protein [Prevotella sp.]